MLTADRELDFELCGMMVLMLGELVESGKRSLRTHCFFEGCGIENISHNIERAFDANTIFVKSSENWGEEKLPACPTGLCKTARRFR